jgi:hypothetical protein
VAMKPTPSKHPPVTTLGDTSIELLLVGEEGPTVDGARLGANVSGDVVVGCFALGHTDQESKVMRVTLPC